VISAGDEKAGSARPRLEHYLDLLPDLGPPSLDLIAEEYRVRRRWGDKPERKSYAERFAQLASELRRAWSKSITNSNARP